MQYKIQMTQYVLRQISNTVAYISQTMLEPENANRWQEQLYKEIASLRTFPARYPLVDIEPWRSQGYRKLSVGTYILYYNIKADDGIVLIANVVSSRRNQLTALREMRK